MGKSAPKAPDPFKVAQAQSGMNTDTAITQQLTNMVNQENPWGCVNYEQNGSTGFTDSSGRYRSVPVFTQKTTYSPQQQAIFDASTQAQTNIANIASEQSANIRNYLNNRFDFGSEFQAPEDFKFNNQDAADWAYDLGSKRILPQQQQDRAALETQLVNRGLRPGTAAWNSELERLGRTQSDQLNQLALTGRQQAFNEQLQGYGTNFNTDLAARQQAFNEAVTTRNQPLNEIASLLSGSQIANPGQASPGTPQATVAGVDYTGLVGQQYQAEMQAHQAGMGGLFGLAGTLGSAAIKAGAFSDIRLKENITPVGKLDNGLTVYSYRYKGGGPQQIGVMAQDVLEVHPEAVHLHDSGFLMVDYERAVR